MTQRARRSGAERLRERRLRIRNELWPDLDTERLWDRTTNDGYTTMPRTMPYIFQIMDELAPKGKPVSQTYMTLWCRVFDEAYIKIDNPLALAYEAGFGGQRASSTWASRMKILVDLGFIEAEEGTSGNFTYVLIYNPYLIIKDKYGKGELTKKAYTLLLERAHEVGADDLSDD